MAIGAIEVRAAINKLKDQNLESETDMELSLARDGLIQLRDLCSKVYNDIIEEEIRRKQLEIDELRKQG